MKLVLLLVVFNVTTHNFGFTQATLDPSYITPISDPSHTTSTSDPSHTSSTSDPSDSKLTVPLDLASFDTERHTLGSRDSSGIRKSKSSPGLNGSKSPPDQEGSKSPASPSSSGVQEAGLNVSSATDTTTTMASNIRNKISVCLSYINGFKNKFVMGTYGKRWTVADKENPPKTCNKEDGAECTTSDVYILEPYLPVVPKFTSYNAGDFNSELVKSFSLLQHYVIALQHLFLDQVFYRGSYMTQVDSTARYLEGILDYLKDCVLTQGLVPDNLVTRSLQVIYRRESDQGKRNVRDFVFLRDT
ncbi:uncharacterized protein LOC121856749 [Homarus americanus]|uniref:Uncharacterized protein n=1 Tax=Homarus americanus TaxID=6706 RepID=A0A8J5J890_HOMAM|nr:uncharacterized protein LOC121856749 [Homarus americanus]XP_042208376.1 uncharacterized protein LOC121856749 [Homarus americanus]KAG7154066.1 hypothetical protein Hamer_G027060 [Homarus americanus]